MVRYTTSRTSRIPKLIGRKKELTEAKSHLEEAIKGNGRLLFVAGEAGIGKSRFMEELGAYAESRGALYLMGRSLYHESSEPYLPFIEALREYISGRKKDTLSDAALESIYGSDGLHSMGFFGMEGTNEEEEEAASGMDYSDEALPMGMLSIGEEPEEEDKIKKIDLREERDRLFNALSQLVIDISKSEPLLLVLDDLQWADDGTLQLLHYLARNIQKSRVLLCGAYSPEELESAGVGPHPLSETLSRMRLEKLFYEINLERLSREESTVLIESLLEHENIPTAFKEQLYEESEGNPFFIEEVIKSLIDGGLIDVRDYTWDMKVDLTKIHMPRTITDAISRRIERLDQNTINILRHASVIGNRFSFNALQKVTGLDEISIVDSIDILLAGNIIREEAFSSEETYKFDHTQLREVVYNSMSRSRRRLMHKKVGSALEGIYKDQPDTVVYALARHFQQGGELQKSILYGKKAAEKAIGVFAPEEALEYYKIALEALEKMEKTDENKESMISLFNSMGEISYTLGDLNKGLNYYDMAIKLCNETGNKSAKAELFANKGEILSREGKWGLAVQNFEKSRIISEKLGDSHVVAKAYRGLAHVYWRFGDYDKATQYNNLSIQASMEVGDMHSIARTFIELGLIYSATGDYEKAIEYYSKSLKELEPFNDYSQIARAHNNIGDAYMKTERYEKAIDHFKKCVEIGKKSHSHEHIGWGNLNLGEANALNGTPNGAKKYVDEALSVMKKMGDRIGIQACYTVYGILYRLQGNWEESYKSFKIAMKMGEENKVPYNLAYSMYHIGLMYRDKGEKDRAKVELTRASEILKQLKPTDLIEKVNDQIKVLNVDR
jgi:tetratricopeptide (TPR) repeat protein